MLAERYREERDLVIGGVVIGSNLAIALVEQRADLARLDGASTATVQPLFFRGS
jgi:hypothetical protein